MKSFMQILIAIATGATISLGYSYPSTAQPENARTVRYFGSEGKGGGVLDINNQIYTFGGVQFRFQKQRLAIGEVRGLSLAIQTIKELPLKPTAKKALLLALTPSDYREYYKVSQMGASDFAQGLASARAEYEETLKKSFRDTLGSSTVEIAILHHKSISLLMPQFDQITDIESQAALLIHEAFRYLQTSEFSPIPSLNNLMTLADLIDLQVRFEFYMRNFRKMSLMFKLSDVFSDNILPLRAAFQFDRDLPEIQALVEDGKYLRIASLFNEANAIVSNDEKADVPFEASPQSFIYSNTDWRIQAPSCSILNQLQDKYPQSQVVAMLMPGCEQMQIVFRSVSNHKQSFKEMYAALLQAAYINLQEPFGRSSTARIYLRSSDAQGRPSYGPDSPQAYYINLIILRESSGRDNQ